MAAAFADAGLPPGVLNVVPAGREVGEHLVRHPLVDKISFTGSTSAGRRIAALCGEQIKRCSLELGGKSAAIVLREADLDSVIGALAPNTMRNNGQTCTNATRVLAHRDCYDDVVAGLREQIGAFVVGDPSDPGVDVGPLVSEVQRERVEDGIATGLREGARLVLGGGRPGFERGYYVEPALFADVDNRMTIAQEEIFGPVVCVIPYADEDEAVTLANASRYGLSGSVWGPDADHAKDVARRSAAATWPSTSTRSTRRPRSAGSRSPASAARTASKASRPTPRSSRSPTSHEEPRCHLGGRRRAVRDRRGRTRRRRATTRSSSRCRRSASATAT